MPQPSRSSFDLSRLRLAIKPFRLHWFPRLRSTNDHAVALRERGTLYAPSVVLTGHQTAGRGRGAHRWWSAGGCLTVTFVLPVDEAMQPHQLPLIAGIAVRRAAEKLSGKPGIQLKWPNDLLHAGRKLGGLLCERVRRADLVGLGLNVNVDPADAPADLQKSVTSLSAIAGRPLDMTDALACVATELQQLIRCLPETPFPALLKEYDEHHALIGRQVSVFDNGDGKAVNGKCEGLDDMGRLLLRDRGVLHHVIAGQVSAKLSK
ncbi:biotin--[acetyl-CoA-carboxylase] ligase [Humisphaera borealis]|uniref:biotin--[biotin carboxyl-carrier protein] ligase n=1 Tax=Humisphaera borealis TaxID=2807512 RepID=A0A7M2WQ64_9BACT|nr:biotin--[acetyl-CoA-carboxylase] ligase [Humisphaera borealis]QOV87543.1 biotin--[acetyl-CoA-carboxylase] ligase [Humisphaera borealis]